MLRQKAWLQLFLLLVSAASIWLACAVNPVTGRRELSLLSEAQEIAMGREADPQIVAAYGLYDDPELAAYVDRIGQQVAKISHRPDLQFTFRVLDSPVINAFALPGGYIYVTRGILAHMNNDAELAMVLGHEVGHVTARHSAQQYSRQTLAGIGLGVGSILVPQVAQFAGLAETALGLMFLKYGRDDERQADELGVQYSLSAGYDPSRGSKFFEVLDRQSQAAGQSLPDWLSTHPAPEDRVVRTQELSEQAMANVGTPLRVGEASFKERIDGVVFGDDPRAGFVEGSTFKHPDLAFEIDFPRGWLIQNTPSAVLSGDKDRQAQLQLTLEARQDMSASQFAAAWVKRYDGVIVQDSRDGIHGYPSHLAVVRVPTNRGEILVQLVTIERGSSMYVLVGFAASDFASWQSHFLSTAKSFRTLTEPAALNIESNRVEIQILSRSHTLSSAVAAASRVPVELATIALLNNLQPGSPLNQGFHLKLVRGTFQPQP